jgi:hypothetical protein
LESSNFNFTTPTTNTTNTALILYTMSAAPGHPPTEFSHAGVAPGGKVRLTSYPSIANAPLPAEGNGTFSNVHLGLLVLFTPAVLLRVIPFVKPSWFSWTGYLFLVILTGVPVTVGYWTVMSIYGPRKNEKIQLPGSELTDDVLMAIRMTQRY